jgi:Flp pilus assembly pilin Flp
MWWNNQTSTELRLCTPNRGRWRSETGATAVEYALLVGLISVGIITSTVFLKSKIAETLKEGAPFVHQFDPGTYGGYINTPSTTGGVTTFATTLQEGPSNYHTGTGYTTLPAIVKSGHLQWAIAACTTNGSNVFNFGVQSGGGDVNNLSMGVTVTGATYSWVKSSTVVVSPTDERPLTYFWITNSPYTNNRVVKAKDIVLGDSTAVDQWIQDHPVSGTC